MSADLQVRWEWPANRNIEKRIAIKVEGVTKAGQGPFGIKGSPSLAAALPDPVVVTGQIVGGDPHNTGMVVRLTLPRLELVDIAAGGYAMLGLVGRDTCICIKPIEADADLQKVSCD